LSAGFINATTTDGCDRETVTSGAGCPFAVPQRSLYNSQATNSDNTTGAKSEMKSAVASPHDGEKSLDRPIRLCSGGDGGGDNRRCRAVTASERRGALSGDGCRQRLDGERTVA